MVNEQRARLTVLQYNYTTFRRHRHISPYLRIIMQNQSLRKSTEIINALYLLRWPRSLVARIPSTKQATTTMVKTNSFRVFIV